jgi:hypothetical protein
MASVPLYNILNIAVPIPWTGIDPATPTTMTAHGRNEIKASEHELIDCPAPESIYRDTALDFPALGNDRHLAAATFRTRLMLEGMRSDGTVAGYTTNFVSAS